MPKIGEPARKDRPSRALPTNRVAFQKQLDILRAFGASSDPPGQPVRNVDVSKLVKLNQTTVGLITPFFVEIGLLQRTVDGLIPVPEVVEFNQAFKWSPETASNRLAPVISKTWFANALMVKLRFSAMSESDAIQELALASSAGPAYRSQVDTLLDYLHVAGVVVRENGQVRQGRTTGGASQTGNGASGSPVPGEHRPESETHRQVPVATSFVHSSAGVVQFNISVKVDMSEFAGWQPDRISAFFAGVAQVLAAKGSLEEESSTPNGR